MLGLLLAGGRTEVEQDAGEGDSEIDTWSGGVYGSWSPPGGPFVDGHAVYGYSTIDTTRLFTFGGLDRQADGETFSHAVDLGLSAGLRMEAGGYAVSPQAGAGYLWVRQRAYTETGAGSLNQAFAAETSRTLTGRVGIEAERGVAWRGGLLAPRLGLFVEGEKPLDDRDIVAGFVGQGSFTTEGDDSARLSLAPRAGVTWEFDGWSLFGDWQGSFADDRTGHAVGVGVRMAF